MFQEVRTMYTVYTPHPDYEYATTDGLIVCEHHHLRCQVPGGDHDVSEAKLQPAIPASCPEVLMTPTNSVSMHAA